MENRGKFQSNGGQRFNGDRYGGNNQFGRWRNDDANENQYENTGYSNGNYNNGTSGYKAKEDSVKPSNWAYRGGRNGKIQSYQLKEDEELLKEHIEHINKNRTFDFNLLNNVQLKTYFKDDDITEENLPYKTFEELKMHQMLLANLERMRYSLMTPIQRNVIPHIVDHKDVMGCSQTGSGKTIAFLAPIINKMLNEGPPKEETNFRASAPVVLTLVPTRELAEQIYKEARKLLNKTGIEVIKVYGGVPYEGQYADLRNGCDILVATPGRLIDFIQKGVIVLSHVKYFIIDEADRILDMGFEEQLRSIVFDQDMPSKNNRQNLMFSATFDTQVRSIARQFMNEYYFITNGQDVKANENIEQNLVYVDDRQKVYKLHEYLQTIKGSVIIFMETKRGVDYLKNFLDRANYNVISIHGDKTQQKRQEAINKFSKGDIPILIATDVASRGLDFPNVAYVFNYDLPKNIDDYVHRIGRTGRCGNKGKAVSFVNDNSMPIVKDLYNLLVKLKQEIPDWFETLYRNGGSGGGYSNGYNNRKDYGGKSYSSGNYGGGKKYNNYNNSDNYEGKPQREQREYGGRDDDRGERNQGFNSRPATAFNKFNNYPSVSTGFFQKGANCEQPLERRENNNSQYSNNRDNNSSSGGYSSNRGRTNNYNSYNDSKY